MKVLRDLLRQEITEGVMHLSVVGSDSASDLFHDVMEGVVKSLRNGLKNKGNKYNSDGYLNVAMIITEYFKGVHHPSLAKLASDVRDNLEKREEKKPFGGDLDKLCKELAKFKE